MIEFNDQSQTLTILKLYRPMIYINNNIIIFIENVILIFVHSHGVVSDTKTQEEKTRNKYISSQKNITTTKMLQFERQK